MIVFAESAKINDFERNTVFDWLTLEDNVENETNQNMLKWNGAILMNQQNSALSTNQQFCEFTVQCFDHFVNVFSLYCSQCQVNL